MRRWHTRGWTSALALSLLLSPASSGAQAPKEAAAAPTVEPTLQPVSQHTLEAGPGLHLTDQVRLIGLLQVDAVAFEQSSVDELSPSTREPLNQERFTLGAARLGLDVRYGQVHGQVQLDGNTAKAPTFRVLSAELGFEYPGDTKVPWVEVALGLFFIPFGFETSEPEPIRLFLESSTWVQALYPGRRDLGARVSGGWSFFRYALAIMNGTPSSGPFALRDPNRAKDFVGRLGVDGPLFPWLHVSAGVSGLVGRGFHAGIAPTKDEVVVRDLNEDGLVQLTEVTLIPGTPGDASKNFERNSLGADLTFHYEIPHFGMGRVYGELAWAKNVDRGLFIADPIAQGRGVRELGFMAAFRQLITRHVEVGVRYDHYDPDRDANRRQGLRFVPSDASFRTLAAAFAWCTLPHLRVVLQYDHRTNPLGRSISGKPTTLAADSLTLRGQLTL
jgi:phosphate-selective porin